MDLKQEDLDWDVFPDTRTGLSSLLDLLLESSSLDPLESPLPDPLLESSLLDPLLESSSLDPLLESSSLNSVLESSTFDPLLESSFDPLLESSSRGPLESASLDLLLDVFSLSQSDCESESLATDSQSVGQTVRLGLDPLLVCVCVSTVSVQAVCPVCVCLHLSLTQLIKKFPPFMEPRGSLPCSQSPPLVPIYFHQISLRSVFSPQVWIKPRGSQQPVLLTLHTDLQLLHCTETLHSVSALGDFVSHRFCATGPLRRTETTKFRLEHPLRHILNRNCRSQYKNLVEIRQFQRWNTRTDGRTDEIRIKQSVYAVRGRNKEKAAKLVLTNCFSVKRIGSSETRGGHASQQVFPEKPEKTTKGNENTDRSSVCSHNSEYILRQKRQEEPMIRK
jgi:hypothetical protein